MPRLTKSSVDALAPNPKRDVWLWDSELPGFGYRVTPNGARSFVVQYRTPQGRTRRLRLARYGELTPDQARRAAAARLLEVRGGRDPSAERRAARVEVEGPATVAELADLWLSVQDQRASKGKVRSRTVAEYRRQIEREIAPRLGSRALSDLAPVDAQRLHDELVARPVLANRCLDLLSALWRWGEGHGYVAGPNPCRSIERNEERRRTRHLSHAELGTLGAALRGLVAAREVSADVAALVRLVAFTGCRPGEIKRLAWADVDLERRVLRLRDAKTGDRDVWLNSPARAVVADLAGRRRTGKAESPWVFPSPRRRALPVGEFRKPWAALLEAAGIELAPPYVLRHTFASESEAIGHSPYVTAELLGHAARRRDMTSVYVHHIGEDLRRASERIGRRIAGALESGKGAAVVPLRRRRRSERGS